MLKVKVARATALDIEGIYEIEKACFDDPWSLELLVTDVLDNPIADYFVAKTRLGHIMGFGGMYHVMAEAHITNIAVLPKYRKKGVAEKILVVMIANAKNHSCEAITLEVRVSNTAAIALYKHFGFKIEGKRPHYYRNNGEDAYIMWLNFNGSRNF